MDCRAPLAVTSEPLLREKCNAGGLANRLRPLIIQGMHLFVLALMMVLLPLRGWTGDAMAVSMAAQQMHQTSGAPQIAEEHRGHQGHDNHEGLSGHATHEAPTEVTASKADCLSHVDCDQMHDAGHSADHGAGSCESCSACQACHNVALMAASDGLTPRLSAVWTPTPVADPFASADAAHDQKPPIS